MKGLWMPLRGQSSADAAAIPPPRADGGHEISPPPGIDYRITTICQPVTIESLHIAAGSRHNTELRDTAASRRQTKYDIDGHEPKISIAGHFIIL